MGHDVKRLVVGVVMLAAASPAVAADTVVEDVPVAVEVRDIIFDLGFGPSIGPKWPTAKVYEPGVAAFFDLKFLRIPMVGEVVTGQTRAFSIGPSVQVIGERDDDDAAYLTGIPDRDLSVELGVKASFEYAWVRAVGAIRYGVIGHNGFVGEVGGDLAVKNVPNLELYVGPRVGFGDDAFMDTYFEVPASALFLPQYDPSGGITTVGLNMEASYALTERVRLHGEARWQHYVGDALDSPITEEGNDHELFVKLGLTYRFGFDVFE